MYCKISNESASPNYTSETKSITKSTKCYVDATVTWNGLFIGNFIINNISDGGMRLYSPTARWIPDEFEIHSASFDQPVKVRKEWSKEGVVLVSARI